MANEGLLRRLGFLIGPWNPWLPEQRRDPYPTYRFLREEKPLCRAPAFGGWVASRAEDVELVLRDKRFTTQRQELAPIRALRRAARDVPDLVAFLDHDLLMIDGAKHTRLRKLVSKAFTPRRVRELEPRIEALVEELLDEAVRRRGGRLELVSDLAEPLPATVIGEMLGVPSKDRDLLHAWSQEAVELLDPLSGREGLEPPKRATRALADYFRTLLAARRREPRDDLLSAMVAAEDEGERLSEAEVLALATLILVAGHETTANLIGNAVVCLLRYPDERKRLRDDPSLLPSAVEEFLRFESPIQITDRVATEDLELRGKRVKRGQLVAVLLGSANRDPARFPEPDRLDLGRSENRHFAFGHGSHFCLGAQLARLEAQVALRGLLRRFPDFRGAPDPPDWKRSAVLRGPTALPLEVR